MDVTITAAAIATLISALTSACITLWILSWNKQKNLDDQLDGLLKIAIQHPYLENKKFADSWQPEFDESDEKMLRYEVYCNLLFNYLARLSEHYKFKSDKIEKHLAIKDWVRLHGKYWQEPATMYENVDSYDKKFVELINSYLK